MARDHGASQRRRDLSAEIPVREYVGDAYAEVAGKRK